MNRFEVKWEIDDGYVGGSRPQSVWIDPMDIEGCETEEDAEKVIQELIQFDFEQTVRWFSPNLKKAAQWAVEQNENET